MLNEYEFEYNEKRKAGKNLGIAKKDSSKQKCTWLYFS